MRRASNVNCDTRALSSIAGEEFRKRIVALVLTAYPEKQRLIHIHIPKTAGSDLRDGLATVLPVISYNYSIPAVYPSAALLVQLARVARRARSADRILVTGHTSLEWYFARGLCRPTDRIFAVVREPKASLMSAVNYYLRRIREDPECKSGDTRSWAIKMNVDRFARDMDVEALRELGKSILDNEAFTRYTGDDDARARRFRGSAVGLDHQIEHELIPLEVYEEWLREQWGINSTKANKSPKVLQTRRSRRRSKSPHRRPVRAGLHASQENYECMGESRRDARLRRRPALRLGVAAFAQDVGGRASEMGIEGRVTVIPVIPCPQSVSPGKRESH